jgi:hypothetical protein
MKNASLISILLLSLIPSLGFSQNLQAVFIANGGVFGSNPPVYATLQRFDVSTFGVQIIDTIRVNSVQDLVEGNGQIFLAAQDSIIVYYLISGVLPVRAAKIPYPGVRRLAVSGGKLFVGKFFGAGSFLTCYDLTNNYQVLWLLPEKTKQTA